MIAAQRRTDRRVARRVVREPEASYSGATALWKASDHPLRDAALLLDTHVWIWTLEAADGTLSDPATALLQRAAANAQLFVSDISHWEVAMLVAKRRLVLNQDVTVWLEHATRAPGLQPLSLTREVLVQSTRLPGTVHGDPADRMLIAQAQLSGLSLFTCDRGIIDYASRERGIPVCDARG